MNRVSKSRRGIVLVAVLSVGFIMIIIGLTLLKLAEHEYSLTHKDVRKMMAFYCAEAGVANFITNAYGRNFENIEETFENLVMDPESENYLIAKINEESELVSASVIEEEMPGNLNPTELTGGSDIVVTLSSTFGYDDANGTLTEAGIFNSENGGVLYNRVMFPEITKTDKFTLSLIWKISF